MPQPSIFISYRRDDARGWPVHLQSAFEQVFGHGQVFLDTRDIPEGDKYPDALRQALQAAKVMLVLIGPDWNPPRDGHRRLDEEDDWVREEVRTGLEHCPLVIPVVLERGSLPAGDELPPALRPLQACQRASIDPHHSIEDVDHLIKRIGGLAAIPICGSDHLGVLALMRLARLQPRAVEAMGAARARLQSSCEQIDCLVARKSIHDQLHRVEVECLNPLTASRSAQVHAGFAATLDDVGRQIGRFRAASELDDLVDSLLSDLLPPATLALRSAQVQPSRSARQAAVAALQKLLTGSLDQFDQRIAESAREVHLDLLAQELQRMLDALPHSEHEADRKGIAASIERLRATGDELRRRVDEHGQLQRVDTVLRALCSGSRVLACADAAMPAGWQPVHNWLLRLDSGEDDTKRRLRAALAAGSCEHLALARTKLQALDLRLQHPDRNDATLEPDLRAAFGEVSRAFRACDTALKEYCLQMGQLRGELAAALASITA